VNLLITLVNSEQLTMALIGLRRLSTVLNKDLEFVAAFPIMLE